MYQLRDFVSKKSVATEALVFTGDESPWEIAMDLAVIAAKLNIEYFKTIPPSPSKYLPMMPIQKIHEFISLNEMATPLIPSKNIGKQLGLDLYFKVEAKNPTGSFKDRGSAVEISVAKELGAKAIILASTGNMAASCAGYAAAAKIPCYILVPEKIPATKLAQATVYGAHIVQVRGNYNDAASLAKKIAIKKNFYLADDYAFRVEGQKTAAFELFDQLMFQIPDLVIVPMGCGTNISAYAKGFHEYATLGLIDRVPKLMGVQAQGAAAIVNSYQQKTNAITQLLSIDTIASAIAVPNPIDGVKALEAIYNTGGCALAVTDQEILQAQHLLATEEGLFVESASAASVAALIKASGQYGNQKIVCVLTGDGLKDSDAVMHMVAKLPIVNLDEADQIFC